MWSAARYSAAAAVARLRLSPSALLTAIMSASSTTPFLRPCRSSPAPAIVSSRKKSVKSATAVSDWPTPTVSTSTTPKPAASQISMASRVLAATPARLPDVGGGRGEGAEEGGARPRAPRHPRLVGENRAAGPVRRRIDREHRDAMGLLGQIGAEGVDRSRLADPWH